MLTRKQEVMKYILSIIICCAVTISTNAQSSFGKLFRSKAPFPISQNSHATYLQTIDSALLVIYNVNDTAPGTNLYLQKLNYSGDVIWEKYIDLPNQMETLRDAVQMPDSSINILCTYDIGNLIYDEEVYFVKINLAGELITTNYITNTSICCWNIADGRLKLNLKNQLLYTHQSYGISFSDGVVYLSDTNYNFLNGVTDPNALYHATAFQDLDSNYFSFGYEPFKLPRTASLIKRNKNFTYQWQKLFRHPATASNKSCIADDALRINNNYVLLTHFEDTSALNNIYIIKTNLNGDSVSSASITTNTTPFGMYALSNGGYILASSNFDSAFYTSISMMLLDSNFQITASRNYRYKNFNERCWSFKPDTDGTFLLAASADSIYDRNIHILKVKPDLCVDPAPSFIVSYNNGFPADSAGILFYNTTDYGILDSASTSATIFFGDGNSADFYADTLSHIYAAQGTYLVTLTVTTACGTSTFSKQVVVPCSGQPNSFSHIDNLLDVAFNYSGAGSFYHWDFGDGDTANTQTTSHVYANPGTFYVCLTTTNSCGTIQICDSITVACTTPKIPFSNLLKACTGTTVLADAGADGQTYLWSDGQSTRVASFTLANTYTVTVTNACGVSATASLTVELNALPLLDIGPDSIMCSNDQAIFTNLITGNNYSYEWYINNQFQGTGNNYYFSNFFTGLYKIVLVGDNNGCRDSAIRNITINPTLLCDTGSYCIPTYTTGTAQGDYIKRVKIGSINNLTGGTGQPAYVDYTNLKTTVNAGQSITIDLEFNKVNPMYYKIWFDYNQDGQFTNAEALMGNNVSGTPVSILTSISPNAYGGPTRMRVRCANSPNTNMDACLNYGVGQTEDYTLIIQNGIGAPFVNFKADTTHIYINDVVNFTDLSYNNPTAWKWTFTGANTVSSTLKNPTGIVYPTPGCYPVTLQAINANGFQIKTDTCYINVDLSLAVNDKNSKTGFSIQPNPFNNQFKLNYKISENAITEIYDVSGRLVYKIDLNKNANTIDIELKSLDAGMYYLSVKTVERVLFTDKLLKL